MRRPRKESKISQLFRGLLHPVLFGVEENELVEGAAENSQNAINAQRLRSEREIPIMRNVNKKCNGSSNCASIKK